MKRQIARAHRASDVVLSFLPRLIATGEQLEVITDLMDTLAARLRALGVAIPERTVAYGPIPPA